MFFNKSACRLIAFLIAGVFALAACDWQPLKNLRTGDKNPPPGSLQLNLGKYSCMSEVGKKVDAYLAGQMNENDIRNFMGCIRGALSKFTTIERGKVAGAYTPAELAGFLNRYYLHDEVLTPAFANEIMKIKVLILGGDLDVITDQEIAGLSDLVTFCETQALANLPYIPLYMHAKSLDSSKIKNADIQNMNSQLQETGALFAKKLSTQDVTYDMASLQAFLTELRKFLKWDVYSPGAQTPAQTVKIVQAYKAVVTAKTDAVIRPEEWTPLFDSITSLFSIWVTYNIQLKNIPLTEGPGLDTLIDVVGDATALLGRIVDRSDAKMITFTASDELVDALADTNILSNLLRPSSIKQAYRFLVQRAFRNPVTTSKGDLTKGLSWQELNEMRGEFDLWANGQKYLSDNASRALHVDHGAADVLRDVTGGFLDGLDFRQFIAKGVDQNDKRSGEIVRIVNLVPPFFRVDDSRAYILPKNDMTKFGVFDSIDDLTSMNTIRALIRLLIRSAGSDDKIVLMSGDWQHTGITEDQMQFFFDNIHDLGVDLKLVDPRKQNTGRRSFDEAKLFTYDGNGVNDPDGQGSELLNFVQGMEYLATIWSGGKVRDMVYHDIDELCRFEGVPVGPSDPFGIPKLNRSCFRQNFFTNKLKEFANLPHLHDDFMKRSVAAQRGIVHDLELIANSQCANTPYIEYGDIATISTVLHYVEAIFSVYDTDHDGSLSGPEAMHAFKRFSGYIGRLAEQQQKKKLSVSMLKAVYAYLLENRKLPSGLFDGGIAVFLKSFSFNDDINQFEDDTGDSDAPDISIDRADLVNVLQVLATSGSTASTPGLCN